MSVFAITMRIGRLHTFLYVLASSVGTIQQAASFVDSEAMNPDPSQTPSQLAYTQLITQSQNLGKSQEHSALQTLYWSERANRKRGAPTPVPSSPAETPQEVDISMVGLERRLPSSSSTQEKPVSLFQPLVHGSETAVQLTAAQMGIDMNDQQAVQQWLKTPVPDRQSVLETMQAYHGAVIRPELYQMVAQIEEAFKHLDDQIFQCSQEVRWLASENRQQQKHLAGTQLLTSGWDTSLRPEEREYQIAWMLSQCERITHFLKIRGLLQEDHLESHLNCLAQEPTTVPVGSGFSAMTTLQFKSWDCRQAFLEAFGGSAGTPLYRDPLSPIPNKHIRVTPASPQFQRKLEAPLRVLIALCNKSPEFVDSQLVILWKTLTLMQPQTTRTFDPEALAAARLSYFEASGDFKGRLEVTPALAEVMRSKPIDGAGEGDTLWAQTWNTIMFGPQLELDLLDAQLVRDALAGAKGSGKGMMLGKGRRHWTTPLLHMNRHNPFPLQLEILETEAVAYVWDEYCDKMNKPLQKCGNYQMATFQGKPPTVTAEAQVKSAPPMPPPLMGGKGKKGVS